MSFFLKIFTFCLAVYLSSSTNNLIAKELNSKNGEIKKTNTFRSLSSSKESGFGVISSKEVNLRSGPGYEYGIKGKFVRKGLPVYINGKIGNWLMVKDRINTEGWVLSSFVSKKHRSGVAIQSDVPVCRLPVGKKGLCQKIARMEEDVIFSVIKCNSTWCRIRLTSKLTGD